MVAKVFTLLTIGEFPGTNIRDCLGAGADLRPLRRQVWQGICSVVSRRRQKALVFEGDIV